MGTSTTRALDSTEKTQTQNNIAIMAGLKSAFVKGARLKLNPELAPADSAQAAMNMGSFPMFPLG